jgi:hypothetical protein
MYYKHLDIKFNPLKDMSYLEKFPTDRYVKYELDKELTSNEMREFFRLNNIVYYDLEAFCCPANFKLGVHCDDAYFGDYSKINFIYSQDPNHTMDWYTPNDNWVESERKVFSGYANKPENENENPAHYWFKEDEITLVHQETIRVAQINAGLPHSVTTGNTNRICLSFIPFFANGNYVGMDYVFQTP